MNRSKVTKGDKDEGIGEPQAHNLGVQVSRGVYPEVPEEGAVWAVKKRAWRDLSGSGRAEGKPD